MYDALLVPALSYAERDRLERRLSLEEEAAIIEATRELISDAAEIIRRRAESEPSTTAPEPSLLGPRERLHLASGASVILLRFPACHQELARALAADALELSRHAVAPASIPARARSPSNQDR